jgi:predicted acylesterase/phospholipase RssA
MSDKELVDRARKFLGGETLKFEEADALWRMLKKCDGLSLARRVLEQIREKSKCLSDGVPDDELDGVPISDILCREGALLTSKDPELSATIRHDEALRILGEGFRFIMSTKRQTKLGDGETLGIAGGICKRRWNDLGQMKDLIKAANFYERATKCYGPLDNPLGNDAYPHINAAFLEDLLATAGDRPVERRQRADKLRQDILEELQPSDEWFNAATRAEAHFGLKQYDQATDVLRQIKPEKKPEPWQLRTTAEQLAHLASLHEERPLDIPAILTFFETLLPGAGEAIRAVVIGKVGLALSGGGFRASFYHLGVLACLAERDVLRDVEVLSCVSGGSIVGACYWLKLRQRLLQSPPPTRDDYIQLVDELIEHFKKAVEGDPRRQVQSSVIKTMWKVAQGAQGALDPEDIAHALEANFYRPLWDSVRPADAPAIRMDELPFTPKDHDPALSGPDEFNPRKHNWLRAHKVPALILNATTVNTGHAWHFTPTWMGESPWTIHEAADNISRLEWCEYKPVVGWQIELSRAVAASACVPLVFEPLRMHKAYDAVDVSLVDGGVHDNQGTAALLGSDCNVILVSDACGQLELESAPPTGITAAARATKRSMDTLMERVRLANFGDLDGRRRSGLLRGLMFLHMKAGLESDVIRLRFSQESYALEHTPLTPLGVRREFQKALARLRTDLDAFTPDESSALMACGYKMASKALDDQMPELANAWQGDKHNAWPFENMLEEITSVEEGTDRRGPLLTALLLGEKVKL